MINFENTANYMSEIQSIFKGAGSTHKKYLCYLAKDKTELLDSEPFILTRLSRFVDLPTNGGWPSSVNLSPELPAEKSQT